MKRIAEPTGCTHVRIGSPTQPSLESEESGPPLTDNFEIVRVHDGLPVALATVGNQEDQADQDFKKVILSLPMPPSSSIQPVSPIVSPPSDEATVKVASASGVALTTLRLEASALRDSRLASELLSAMLLPTNTNEPLNVPRKELRKTAVNYIIQVCFLL